MEHTGRRLQGGRVGKHKVSSALWCSRRGKHQRMLFRHLGSLGSPSLSRYREAAFPLCILWTWLIGPCDHKLCFPSRIPVPLYYTYALLVISELVFEPLFLPQLVWIVRVLIRKYMNPFVIISLMCVKETYVKHLCETTFKICPPNYYLIIK